MENRETPKDENKTIPDSDKAYTGMGNSGTPPPMQNAESINQQFENVFNQQFGQQPIPNATGVLVCGIISLPICFCPYIFGIPGMVLAIVSLVLHKKAKLAYEANPSLYTQSSFNNLKAGRVCAIIGLIINILCFLFMIAYVVFFVSLLSHGFMGNSLFK